MSKVRVKRVIKKMVENGGKSVSKAMLEVGYKPTYAKNPQKLTESKGFKELIDEFLPDSLITQRHNELANACELSRYEFLHTKSNRKQISELTNNDIREIIESVPGCKLIYVKRDDYSSVAYFSQPDHHSRKDAIDMAYKLKGSYSPDKLEITKRKYQDMSNADLANLEKTLKNFLLKK